MDYFKIIIEGYAKENSRSVLDKYFIRKYNEAKEQFYSLDEFFNGCQEVINSFYSEMYRRLFDRQNELHMIINWKKKGMTGDNDTPKEPSNLDLQVVNELEQEVDEISRYNFPVNLFGLTKGTYTGNINENEVQFIEQSINLAKDRAIKNLKTFHTANNSEKSKNIAKSLSCMFFFRIKTKSKIVVKGKSMTILEYNDDGIITIENWGNLKDTFYSQRINTEHARYTLNERIELEIGELDKLVPEKADYKVLKKRYANYLENKLNESKDTTIGKKAKETLIKPTELKLFFNEDVSNKLIGKLKKEFKGYINKDMAILIYLLDKVHGLITIHNTSKGKTRKSFVESLSGKQHKSIQSINNHFQAVTEVLKTIGENDSSYIEIKNKLDKIVSSC